MSAPPMLVTSRSALEYAAFFDLDLHALPASIIDVSAGAAGFVAEASRRGVRALGADPVYADRRGLARAVQSSIDRAEQMVIDHDDSFTFDWYGSPQRRGELRRHAGEEFMADLDRHPEHYVAAALPRLPLAENAFELALCSHLLFTWAEMFDENWHHRALVELTRVAREVRVFPMITMGAGSPVPFLSSLRRGLEQQGISSEVREVNFEFQRGGRHQLVLRHL